MSEPIINFDKVYKTDMKEYVESKGNLSYLPWANAWAEFMKIYPNATYIIKKDEQMRCWFGDEKKGYMVYTSVTVEALTHEMWLPVMDFRNKSILTPSTFDINKTLMRCLTKNLAMFGLGLYIYAGEDLPTDKEEEPVKPVKEKVIPKTNIIEERTKLIDRIMKAAKEKGIMPIDLLKELCAAATKPVISFDDIKTDAQVKWVSAQLTKRMQEVAPVVEPVEVVPEPKEAF